MSVVANERLQGRVAQEDARTEFKALGARLWTPVFETRESEPRERLLRSALAPASYREKALSDLSYDLLHGGDPGFVYVAGRETAEPRYFRFGNDMGVEPL